MEASVQNIVRHNLTVKDLAACLCVCTTVLMRTTAHALRCSRLATTVPIFDRVFLVQCNCTNK